MSGGEPSSRAVGTLFLGAAVFVALMVMAVKTGTTIIAGWRLPGARERDRDADRGGQYASSTAPSATTVVPAAGSAASSGDERVRSIVAALSSPAQSDAASTRVINALHMRGPAQVIPIAPFQQAAAARDDPRTGEVGQRFSPAVDLSAKERIS